MMILAALSFVLGAWLAQQLPQLPSVAGLIGLVAVAVGLWLLTAFSRKFPASFFLRLVQQGLLLLAWTLLGLVWASAVALYRLQDTLPHAWEQKTIAIEGVVASAPELSENGLRFRFDVEKVLTNQAVVPQYISLNQYAANTFGQSPVADSQEAQSTLIPFHAGERWLVNVRLKRPHGTQNPQGFDFEAWALSENVRATGAIKLKAGYKKREDFVWRPQYMVERVRELIAKRISTVLSHQPYTGIIKALVMGDDSQISVSDWQVFLRTGTSHLMSISGLHITMLAGLAFAFVNAIWRRVPVLALAVASRKAATTAGVLTALCYALVAGFSVPTQRTLYMLITFALALWSGRSLSILQVLAVALWVVVVLDPWAVIAPGFWLSFGAVAVLAFAFGGRVGQARWFLTMVKSQWAVTIGMLPLLLVMFNQASIISPIANALAIPLISFIVTPLALLGSFLPWDGPLLWAHHTLSWGMNVLNWLNANSTAVWQQHAPAIWTLFPALVGAVWLLLPRGFPLRWLGVLGFIPMLFIKPSSPLHGDMHVTVLDVGQGLSVVVQTQHHAFLYDTGPKHQAKSDAASRIIVPYLHGAGIHQLHGVMVSHNDLDHSGGLSSLLQLMPVGWLNSALPDDVSLPNTLDAMACYAGQTWAWDGVDFEVLHPSLAAYADDGIEDNERSCVLKITSQAGSLLLTGDIEKGSEQSLLQTQADLLNSDVLLVPHHGSKTSSTSAFIQAVSPSISIFTAGYLNRYQHPKAEVLARYQATHGLIYRSDLHGAVSLAFTQEQGIQVASWRLEHPHYWYNTVAR